MTIIFAKKNKLLFLYEEIHSIESLIHTPLTLILSLFFKSPYYCFDTSHRLYSDCDCASLSISASLGGCQKNLKFCTQRL